ncbi:MAG: uncharacterized protein PWP15_1443 [Methanothermococcus sp.]|uniref:nucleotidyltransferase domain-containing protein n=1 Tax=Methanothermococcus TaxID=155862 RepID=UPI000362F566|nr:MULTISPECIES: nucleotidyltransferase domain-containing protein [Methanothermococcus]MDK2790934.1 uncharacterized protein [Methanothermococcus sp.]
MRTRLRDFVEVEEGFFAVNTYYHPEDRIISFLRYLNLEKIGNEVLKKYELDPKDIRTLNGKKYIKVAETGKAYEILKEYYPEYLFYDEFNDVLLHGIPKDRVKNILRPHERLEEILNSQNNEYEEKCAKLANILNEYGLDYKNMGVSGSTVLKLNNKNSDIDFVIYGMKNHKKAREILEETFKDGKLSPLSDEFWQKAYKKRIKDGTLSYDEFVWHEKRKFNRGVVDGVMFDLLATREWDEITENYGSKKYENLGFVKIEATVKNDDYMFDNPAVYEVEDVKILNTDGLDLNYEDIKEVVSFTHTYAGQCFEGERIVVRGKLENVIFSNKGEKNNKNYKRVVVGTSREAFNEYIKLV